MTARLQASEESSSTCVPYMHTYVHTYTLTYIHTYIHYDSPAHQPWDVACTHQGADTSAVYLAYMPMRIIHLRKRALVQHSPVKGKQHVSMHHDCLHSCTAACTAFKEQP